MQNEIEKILKQNIKNLDTVFIFPTQTAADLWADRIISVSDVKAVAMERFVAWDDFKGEAIRGTKQDKKAIPSTLRTFFASKLISENAEKPFLKDIIVPKFAKSASGFESWIQNLLPALSMWKTFFDNSKKNPDSEDEDLLLIYDRYKYFLDEHKLFDPAWETPPFKSDGRKYIIFYPEILSDWFEYEKILKSSPDITLVNLPKNPIDENQVVFTFPDSRSEIKNAARYIRNLHEEKKIAWNEICVSVPDMDSYGTYVDRELDLFEIPHVMRYAKPLSSSGAANVFSQIQSCYETNFSYESVKNLLLNTELPWKEKEMSSQLISFGQENNCICGFNENGKNVDVWEESFKRSKLEERARNFYDQLKKNITQLVNAESFEKIREHYFVFREAFFNMEECSEKANRIISRCISELASLIDLEKEYKDCKISSPYSFFVRFLGEKKYLEQTDQSGVQVFPYRLSAVAPFASQIVLDASQASLAVVYEPLSFLREDKRVSLLNTEDFNATEQHIALYQRNSLSENAWFSSGNKTFSGYAQPVSSLKEVKFENEANVPVCEDFYKNEKNWYDEVSDFPDRVTEISKNSNETWRENYDGKQSSIETDAALNLITEKASERHSREEKLKISSTQLNQFMLCPRKSLLSSVLNLQEQNNEAEIIAKTEIGDLNHKVIELYLKSLKAKNLPLKSFLALQSESMLDEYNRILKQSVHEAINVESKENLSFIAGKLVSATENALFEKMQRIISCFSEIFDGYTVDSSEEWLSFETEDFLAEGKVDCVLREGESAEPIIIDFKTSSAPAPIYYEKVDSNIEQIPDFQMPMYLYLLKNAKGIEAKNAAFFVLNKAERKAKGESENPLAGVIGDLSCFSKRMISNMKTYDEFQQTMLKFEESLEIFADSVKNGKFEFDESKVLWETCNKCDYRAVCRRTFNVGKM